MAIIYITDKKELDLMLESMSKENILTPLGHCDLTHDDIKRFSQRAHSAFEYTGIAVGRRLSSNKYNELAIKRKIPLDKKTGISFLKNFENYTIAPKVRVEVKPSPYIMAVEMSFYAEFISMPEQLDEIARLIRRRGLPEIENSAQVDSRVKKYTKEIFLDDCLKLSNDAKIEYQRLTELSKQVFDIIKKNVEKNTKKASDFNKNLAGVLRYHQDVIAREIYHDDNHPMLHIVWQDTGGDDYFDFPSPHFYESTLFLFNRVKIGNRTLEQLAKLLIENAHNGYML